MNIIDTPGVLSGEKQRTSRGYDFAKVSEWFANRSDLILLMFDPSKLDISDEFKSVIEELRPYEDKVHCVLNKADSLDPESLMRVYGALLWSMGKIFHGAEVTRVYVGSFKEDQAVREEHKELFKKDRDSLMNKLEELPRACGMRKVNDMVKRIRLLNFNACLLGYLKSKMPYLYGKQYAQDQLIEKLPEIFQKVKQLYNLSEGDFPDIKEYANVLKLLDFTTFPSTKRETLLTLRNIMNDDIPLIMSQIHQSSDSKDSKDVMKLKEEEKRRDVITFPVSHNDSNMMLYLVSFNFVLIIAMIAVALFYVYASPDDIAKYLSPEQINAIDGILKQFKK